MVCGEAQRKISAILIAVILAVGINFSNYRNGNIEFIDSDATWHTLLTLEAYDETPWSVHKFLPIVSLGGTDDKFIPWGATISDESGNYYYTSFSPAGYFLPYLFMKGLSLPIDRESLYIFNTVLLAASAGLFVWFLLMIFKGSKFKWWLSVFGTTVYLFAPEVMHGMGLVYWHQSILQVTLLLQMTCYFLWKTEGKRGVKWAFLVLCVLNPYVEWTGYVANVGFIVCEFLLCRTADGKSERNKNSFLIALCTLGGFLLYCLHFLWVVSLHDFSRALYHRFMARNIKSSGSFLSLGAGYFSSIGFAWCMVAVLLAWLRWKMRSFQWVTKSRFYQERWILVMLAFPVLENFLMKQHAILYSYDRMKAVFVFVFLLCDLLNIVLVDVVTEKVKQRCAMAVFSVALCGLVFCNTQFYRTSGRYVWDAPYMAGQKELAAYLNAAYPGAIYCTNVSVRGYINLTFGRGVYENVKDISDVARRVPEYGGKTIIYIEQVKGAQASEHHLPTATCGLSEWKVFVYDPSDGAKWLADW